MHSIFCRRTFPIDSVRINRIRFDGLLLDCYPILTPKWFQIRHQRPEVERTPIDRSMQHHRWLTSLAERTRRNNE